MKARTGRGRQVVCALVVVVAADLAAAAERDHRIVARTGDLGLVEIAPYPSINDSGYVAFVGRIEGSDGRLLENIYSWAPDGGGILRELFNPGFLLPNAGADPTQTFGPEVQINNSNKVVARRYLRAIVLVVGGSIQTAPLTYLELWDAATQHQSYCTQITSGNGGVPTTLYSFLNPLWGGVGIPSAVSPSTPFSAILNWPTINNNGLPVFTAIRSGTNYLSTQTSPGSFVGASSGSSLLRPALGDNGNFVFRAGADPTNSIWVMPYTWNPFPLANVASTANGFSIKGQQPGITDAGTAVAFAGVNAQGPGIFVATQAGGWTARRVAGVSGNGVLDPGETYDDLNANQVFDPGSETDEGPFSGFELDARVVVNGIPGAPTGWLKVCFVGYDTAGARGVFATTVPPPGQPAAQHFPVVAVGDTIRGLGGVVQAVALHDGLNNEGECAVWVSTGGQQAIVVADLVEIVRAWNNEVELRTTRDRATVIGEVLDGNRSAHHTDLFAWTPSDPNAPLVLRRAQEFDVTVQLSRPFDPNTDRVSFQLERRFTPGSPPPPLDVPVATTLDVNRWCCQTETPVLQPDGSYLVKAKIQIPRDAAIGRYELFAMLSPGPAGPPRRFPMRPVIVLFNPWKSEDAAYLDIDDAADTLRKEYVLNTTGRVWTMEPSGFAWTYAQFEDSSATPGRGLALAVALERLLDPNDTGALSEAERGDPVHVARRITERVDRDVCWGKWGEPPYPGINGLTVKYPWDWTSSKELLKLYYSTGARVQYTQCWVYAGVLNSLLRCVGLAARPVTNYGSAVDTGSTGPIVWSQPEDLYLDWYYTKVPSSRDPNVLVGVRLRGNCDPFDPDDPNCLSASEAWWNFHAWCDVYMDRADNGRDGWQAIDATPHTRPGGQRIAGPAALSAIKANAGGQYDVRFVRGEVDADVRLYGLIDPNDAYLGINLQPSHFRYLRTAGDPVGTSIVTKSVGSDAAMDITGLYKSFAARDFDACLLGGTDVEATLVTPAPPALGDDFEVQVALRNTGSSSRTVDVSLVAWSTAYDGQDLKDLADASDTLVLAPGEEQSVSLAVPEAAYVDEVFLSRTLHVIGEVTLLGTTDACVLDDNVTLSDPALSVTTTPATAVRIGDQVTANVSFVNPLNIALTDALLRYSVSDGLALGGGDELTVPLGTVPPGGMVNDAQVVGALTRGTHSIAVALHADQLDRLNGAAEVRVLLADFDGDGQVDAVDQGLFASCFSGSGNPHAGTPLCIAADFDGDEDVDCRDWLELVRDWTDPATCPAVFTLCTDDCNQNGVSDACEAVRGLLTDTDFDGLYDPCDACPNDWLNDADGDGICGDDDFVDLLTLAQCLAGPDVSTLLTGCSVNGFAAADLDLDGDVDLGDVRDLQLGRR